MNQRFQALADEAEEYADSVVDAGGEFHPAYTRKLAELIVKECAEVVDNDDSSYPYDSFGHKLKQHFGVEE